MLFGSIWHRFWKGFGRILEGSGKDLGKVLKEDGAIQNQIKIMLFTGGGRCLREAVSIRPPPGRRRVESVLAVPSDP